MADTLSPMARSLLMQSIHSKDTGPELVVRRMIHAMGIRYALHRRDLPGCPDLVLAPRRKVIFVHGCFWHSHTSSRCRLARLPKSRRDYWLPKLASNRKRDEKVKRALRKLGWKILVVWECQLRDKEQLKNKLWRFLEGNYAGG
jgi:DNA mismatch endonuclease, patch repair protein